MGKGTFDLLYFQLLKVLICDRNGFMESIKGQKLITILASKPRFFDGKGTFDLPISTKIAKRNFISTYPNISCGTYIIAVVNTSEYFKLDTYL